jgi:very-short-patch-repair endonuclease
MRPRFTKEILASKGFLPNGTKAKKAATKSTTQKATQSKRKKSSLCIKFEGIWKALGGMPLVEEHKFHPTRKWRFDYSLPAHKIAIEIDGGVYGGGRHNRGSGFINDCEKFNEATALGWYCYRIPTPMVSTGYVAWVLEQIRRTTLLKKV